MGNTAFAIDTYQLILIVDDRQLNRYLVQSVGAMHYILFSITKYVHFRVCVKRTRYI